MKTISTIAVCFLLSLVNVSAAEWISLSSETGLKGWHTQKQSGIHGKGGHWGVTKNGVLFGEQNPPGSGEGGLLLTDQTFGEFELELSLKPDWGPDSGVFIRTNEKGEGWQIYVDYHDNGNVGHVRLETKAYSVPFRPFSFSRINAEGESLKTQKDARSNKWPKGVYEQTCTAGDFLRTWKTDDWNRMRIRCTGEGLFPVIEVWVNDLKICRFDSAKTTHPGFDREKAKKVLNKKGSIGLQVHKGNAWPKGARVFWKDVKVKPLGKKSK